MAYSAILYRRPIFYKISASGETPPTPSISVTYTNSVGGTISTSGQTDVTEGTPFSNVATANTLFNFVEWLLSEDGGVTWVSISTDAELNYTYEGDSQSVTVKAMFEPDALNFYMPDGGTITLTKNGSPTVVELEYSIDGGATWWVWEEVGNVRSLTLAVGGKMYVRNTSQTITGFTISDTNFYQFAFDSYTYAGGNITSLLSVDSSSTTIISSCFLMLFHNCSLLRTPADMSSVTSIGTWGCYSMYTNCTSLITAADMSSVTNIDNNGCRGMYQGCTSLTTAADMNNITSIKSESCENMYSGCTSLTTAADMSSVTSINSYGCDSMYANCTSLITAANISGITSIDKAGCRAMYFGCTSLMAIADMSSVTSIGTWGCKQMYYNCTHLATVIIGNPTIGSSSLSNWLYGVAPTGDFYCLAELTIPTGANGIPEGWTRHDI